MPRIRGKAPAKKPVATSISRPFTFCQCRRASRQNGGASKSGRFRLFRSPSRSLRVGSCTARATDKRRLRRVACRRNTPSASATISTAQRLASKLQRNSNLACQRFLLIHQNTVEARITHPTFTFLHNRGNRENEIINGIKAIIIGLCRHASAKRKCIRACSPRNVPHPGHCNPVSA